MKTIAEIDEIWPFILTLLPQNLDESAAECGALVRKRGIRDAEALLRILLTYGCTDLSLKSVAAWAEQAGLSECSTPALFYRVRDSHRWLAELLTQVLAPQLRPVESGLRLRVVDATVLCGPGAEGTEWRLHVLSDPSTGRLCNVELTNERVGETYALHPLQRGDVVLGDRGYSTARGLYAVAAKEAFVVVRLNPHVMRLCNAKGERVHLLQHEARVPKTGVMSWDVLVPIPPDKTNKSHKTWSSDKAKAWLPARVLAARTRKGDVIWVLSTVPKEKATNAQIMDLYRLRWQVELQFKRLKSLLALDQLPTGTGPTAQSWILARLLAAALAEQLLAPDGAFSPWGYRLRAAPSAPAQSLAGISSRPLDTAHGCAGPMGNA